MPVFGCDLPDATRHARVTDAPVTAPPAPASVPEGSPTFAAIQYGAGRAEEVAPSCVFEPRPDVCAITALIHQAVERGANFVVAPEYGFEVAAALDVPEVGAILADGPDPRGRLAHFSAVARDARIHLAINVITADADGANYNTLILFDEDGRVLANHHKFELFSGEKEDLTAGEGVTVVETRWGRVGLMVCADLYGDLRLHHEMIEERKADVVLVSAHWTVDGAERWPSNFARNFGVPVVSANTTNGPGGGGGIFDANGRPYVTSERSGVVVHGVPMGKGE